MFFDAHLLLVLNCGRKRCILHTDGYGTLDMRCACKQERFCCKPDCACQCTIMPALENFHTESVTQVMVFALSGKRTRQSTQTVDSLFLFQVSVNLGDEQGKRKMSVRATLWQSFHKCESFHAPLLWFQNGSSCLWKLTRLRVGWPAFVLTLRCS